MLLKKQQSCHPISFVSLAKLVEALTSKHIGSNQILSSLQILRVQPTQKNWQPRFVKKSSSPRRSLPRKNHGKRWESIMHPSLCSTPKNCWNMLERGAFKPEKWGERLYGICTASLHAHMIRFAWQCMCVCVRACGNDYVLAEAVAPKGWHTGSTNTEALTLRRF